MAEYIERNAAIRALTLHDCDSAGAKIAILDIPAADVAPVVHGRWVHTSFLCDSFCEVWQCSCCSAEDENGACYNYCPNCGAKMDKEAHNGLDTN